MFILRAFACIYYALQWRLLKARRREKWKAKERESSIDQSKVYIFSAAAVLLFGLEFNNPSVFFVRWFRTPFFEQVVYALGVLVVTSLPDG